MKKIMILFLTVCMVYALVACSGQPKNNANTDTGDNTERVDVDLTKLSSTMVYSEVFNMMSNPQNYEGKTVKMNGTFSVYHDDYTGKNYFACLIADATACCSQGIEFVLAGEHTYPNDYPELGSNITVTGIFGTYMEGSSRYCQLTGADMK